MRKVAITTVLGVGIACGAAGFRTLGQDPPPANAAAPTGGGAPAATTQDTVSRAEYEQLKRDQDELKKELAEMKRERALERQRQQQQQATAPPTQAAGAAAAAAAAQQQHDEDMEEIDKTLRDIKTQLHEYKLGSEKLLIAGDAFVGFTSQKNTKSTFSAGIAPLALWQPYDKLLIEAAADIGIDTDDQGHSSTSFDLTIANASFIVSDNLILGGGLFVAPFGVYHRHFDPPWINKLPDDPLVFSDGGLAPGSILGFFASGAVPVHDMKFTYDAYVSNGPNLETTDPGSAGSLHFDNYHDLNNNKAVGGRIGFIPCPQFEMGYSVQYGKANSTGFDDVTVLIQAVDAAYRRDFKEIFGTLDIHGEWVWSDVSKATYDPTGALGFGPTRFSNFRHGGYILVAYRPSLVDNKILKKTEFIVRYDLMHTPMHAPGGEYEQRWALGLDYWITPSAVIKAAYEFDIRKVQDNADAFMLQLGLGL
jgi:hypothetical protein